ncbi:hypothetical protein [Alkalitalea saponilacus]|uniref:Uncharacterized protein n=1 Tax=Alkalitalea saponilacus TaxID=889453 RepID=A0A1T5HS00_9BACT|nr:hypothetical protein [Alkalitalea saponilacus]ASB50010.1 hypothetical protein CDL62_13125 [Alkalitalea saponilacus]SKC23478.1 hypothetical protein SAMN03080601_02752 [Alkalitalea saponilacus]
MKRTKLFTIFAAAIIIFAACSKDSSDKFEDLSKYKFADESADKGKAALENSGQQLMSHMTNMQSLAAMDVMESMMHYLESGSLFTDEFDLFLNNSHHQFRIWLRERISPY